MGAAVTKLTFEEFQNLPEHDEGRYELDEGELLVTPSPTFQHNRIRERIARRLSDFVENQQLGEVTIESDFRLGPDTVRNPDVAFVTTAHLGQIDVNRSPVEGAPALVVEIISPANTAQDNAKKIRQYLQAGCRSVWIVYPLLRQIEIHTSADVRKIQEPELLSDNTLFPRFSLPLRYVFDGIK